ncbi:hypothetical protein ACFVHB_15845 [Kitasatospora sp. NPDC127111]|uniref:hypothetical protein n=1 Tax=Kitasatospora sp. NPDC127111 TaxID=3345363 RepID=UPI0036264C13
MTPGPRRPAVRLLRWALALYPASYGTTPLAEVADHAERHLARAGRLGGLREVADVAAHGARLRLGLVSHRPLGRAFATAAPLAAVLAGTYAAAHLWWAFRMVTDPDFETFSDEGAQRVGPFLAAAVALLPAVLMLGAVLARRWSSARALALVAVVAPPLIHVLARPELLGGAADTWVVGLSERRYALIVLNALILLLAPPDRAHPRSVAPWAVAVPIMAADITITLTGGIVDWINLSGFDIVAPVATGAAVACTARTIGRTASATAVLAAPPLLTPALTSVVLLPPLPFVQRLTVLYALGCLVALVAVRLTARRSRPADLTHT